MKLKKTFYAFQILVLFSSICQAANPVVAEITSTAKLITESLTENKKRILAVTDFTDLEGNVNILGRFLAEEISISLASTEKDITVIDRNQLKKMLAEKNILTAGVLDPGLAKQIGKISGAEAILTGSAYPVSGSLYVSVKVIDVDTARIFAGASTTIERNQIIDELVKTSFKIPQLSQQIEKTSFAPQVREAYDFVFILQEPIMDGNTMILNIDVRNNLDQPRYLTVDSVRAIDDTGKIYYPSSFTLGGIRAYIGESGKIQSMSAGKISENCDVWMRENQQIKAQITLKNISPLAKSIGFLEMAVAPVQVMERHGTSIRLEDDLSPIQFMNISVKREKDGSKP
ncbi:MAG: FlgO family outer membrane protein [Candidatus Omnitrophica bacterium]|nr:FlgO family outer membrane protein [Candidatus Omnitrophota bacterium]MCM8788487.1 FlgO family outer membrane protein [Candidatus Omnitrophota bacterium]